MAHPHVRAKRGLAEKQAFAYIDCRSLINLDQGECYKHIQGEIIQQVKNMAAVDKAVGARLEKAVQEGGWEIAPFFSLDTLLQVSEANGLRLIISLDNFEILAYSSCLKDCFFSALRSFPITHQMAYLVASRHPLDELERIRGPEASPFFNIFQPITLGPFTSEESRRLVIALLERAAARFPEFVIDSILELGNREPYNLQRAGYAAFELWQENGKDLQMEHCEEIRQRFEGKEKLNCVR